MITKRKTKLRRSCKNHSVVVKCIFQWKYSKSIFCTWNSIGSSVQMRITCFFRQTHLPWIFFTVEEWNPFTSSVYLEYSSRVMIPIEWHVVVKFRFENIKSIYVTPELKMRPVTKTAIWDYNRIKFDCESETILIYNRAPCVFIISSFDVDTQGETVEMAY